MYRLDYWLISDSLIHGDIKLDFHPSPLTDHKARSIFIKLSTVDYKLNVYWKLKNSILEHDTVISHVKKLASYFFSYGKHRKQIFYLLAVV